MAATERAAPAQAAEPKPPPGLGKAVQVFAKLLSGDSFTLNCPLDARVDFVKRLVEWKATINGRDIPAGCQRLIFAGKNLEDHHTLEGKRLAKESTFHVMDTRGRATTMEEKETFDGTDGFIVTSSLDVAPARRWLLDNQGTLSRGADPWFANQLKYFLERDGSNPFSEVIADHWHRGLGVTQNTNPFNWPDVPEPIRELDAQLRKKLIDLSQGEQPLPLLGDRETGDFVLGYAQLTLMPVNKSKREAGVGAHSDHPAYGDVIITVGIAGQAEVVLTKEAKSTIGSSTVVPILRRRTIKAAMAYCLYGQSRCGTSTSSRRDTSMTCPRHVSRRWKVKHDVLVSDSVPPLDGLVMMDQQKKAGYTVPVARVAVTLRYFRRSWCELLLKARQPSPPLAPPPPAVEAGDIVDVFSYGPGGSPANRREYPYTYPAIVVSSTHTLPASSVFPAPHASPLLAAPSGSRFCRTGRRRSGGEPHTPPATHNPQRLTPPRHTHTSQRHRGPRLSSVDSSRAASREQAFVDAHAQYLWVNMVFFFMTGWSATCGGRVPRALSELSLS